MKNYRQIFKEAKAQNNWFQMELAFNEVCQLADIPDEAGEMAQEEAGRARAELLNAQRRGDGAKKL